MDTYTEKYSRWFDVNRIPYIIVDNVLWREYNKMVVPVGPVSKSYSLSIDDAKALLKRFPQSMLCRWTSPPKNDFSESGFYAVVCKSFVPHENLPSKRRNEILRGISHCIVRQIDAETMQKQGYDVYCKATRHYNASPVSIEQFSGEFILHKGFEDIIHYWGVFFDDVLVAYAKVLVYGREEANVTVAKFDPDFHKYYPSYALFYAINEMYLKQSGFHYVNDGFKSLHHQTNIQDFLIRKFGYEKFYVDLFLKYRTGWNSAIKFTSPFRTLMKRIHPGTSALYAMNDIVKHQNSVK